MSFSVSNGPAGAPTSVACFSVVAANDPATLPRVLEVFAKLGHTPFQCYATRHGVRGEEVHIDLQYEAMTHVEADHMARALRGQYLVQTVLTSQKEMRLSA